MNKKAENALGLSSVVAAVAIVAIVGLVLALAKPSVTGLAASENACDKLSELQLQFCSEGSPACKGVSNALVKAGCSAAPTCFSIWDYAGTGDVVGAQADCVFFGGQYCAFCYDIGEKGACGGCVLNGNEFDCTNCQQQLLNSGCPGMCPA